MIQLIAIIAVIFLIYFIGKHLGWWGKGNPNSSASNSSATQSDSDDISNEPILQFDDNGRGFYEVLRIRQVPRKTYIKGVLFGKYRGEFDPNASVEFQQVNFFDIEIYEGILKSATFSNEPYKLSNEIKITNDKIPRPLIISLEESSISYEVDLKEPVISVIDNSRKLHQVHDNYVFGTIEAHVTGYILDYLVEEYTEREYVHSSQPKPEPPPILTKTGIPTGKVEVVGNYKRAEYYYSDMIQTYWGVWEYVAPTNRTVNGSGNGNVGCFGEIFNGLVFLCSLILVGLFLFLLLRSLSSINWNIDTIKRSEEVFEERDALIDSIGTEAQGDSLIRHKRVWRDYDGNEYQGVIWTKVSDYRLSNINKSNLNISTNTNYGYDEMMVNLFRNDRNRLDGVYPMFDSIQSKHNLSNVKFAELIVSFVQDIPYSVVLTADCDPNLYDQEFIKEYLATADARCYGNQKFGINTPVEFMTTMYGDCDTRTLLLYTILEHYNYDVALMSSEYYSHSILGVNIPVNGTAYYYQNQRYVLWETTSPNLSAGVLPDEISDLNYWRISIKSK